MINGKHILFISYDGMTDPLGQSQVIPYLAGLSKQGYRFTILSCDKAVNYAKHKDYVTAMLKPYSINWVSVAYTKKPPVLSSMYDVMKLKKKAKQIHLTDPVDMVHTRPGVPTLVALWLKKNYGIKFFNDIRGFWADERVDGGMWNLNNPVYNRIYKFFKKHEEECLEKAEHSTCLTYSAKREMLSWKQIKNQDLNFDVIPCSVDLDLFNSDSVDNNVKEKFRLQLGIKTTDIVISYLGSLGGWYLTNEMLQFAKLLTQRNRNIKLLFITPHNRKEVLDAARQAEIDEECIITCSAKRHEVPAFLSLSAFSLFFIKPCYSKMSSSPTKHGEIMAMGIPVITNTGVGDVEEIVKKYNAGILIKDFSEGALAEAADQLFTTRFDRLTIRKGAEEFYALENAVSTYSAAYKKIFFGAE